MIAAEERAATGAAKDETPAILERIMAGLARRASLAWARLRYPRAHFGARSEIRRGFHLALGRDARLTVGERCILDRDMTIECRGTLTIGDGTIFGHHCTLASRDSLIIGRDCLIAEMVSMRDSDQAGICVPVSTQPPARHAVRPPGSSEA